MSPQEFEHALRVQATNPPHSWLQVIDEGAECSEYRLHYAYWGAKRARAQEIGWDAMMAERAQEAAPRPPFDYREALRVRHLKLSEPELVELDQKAKREEVRRQERALGIFPSLYEN